MLSIVLALEAAARRGKRSRSYGNSSKSHCLVVRQLVHGVQSDVVVRRGDINSRDGDAVGFSLWIDVGEVPAPAAVGRVPGEYRGCASDARERGQGAESRESTGLKAIWAVRACYRVQRLAGIVVSRVIRHRESGNQGREEGERSEDEGELHEADAAGVWLCEFEICNMKFDVTARRLL